MQILVNIRFFNGIELYWMMRQTRVLLKFRFFFLPGTGFGISVVCVSQMRSLTVSRSSIWILLILIQLFACDMLYVGMWEIEVYTSGTERISSPYSKKKCYRHSLVSLSQCVRDFWDFLSCLSFHLLCSFVWLFCIWNRCDSTDACFANE